MRKRKRHRRGRLKKKIPRSRYFPVAWIGGADIVYQKYSDLVYHIVSTTTKIFFLWATGLQKLIPTKIARAVTRCMKYEIPILSQVPKGMDSLFIEKNSDIDVNFLVRNSDFMKGGILDREILLQRLIMKLLKEGWIPPTYDRATMLKYWNRFKAIMGRSVAKIKENGIEVPAITPDLSIDCIMHFFDLKDDYNSRGRTVSRLFNDPKALKTVIMKLIKQQKDLTRGSILSTWFNWYDVSRDKWSKAKLGSPLMLSIMRLFVEPKSVIYVESIDGILAASWLDATIVVPKWLYDITRDNWRDISGSKVVLDVGQSVDLAVIGTVRSAPDVLFRVGEDLAPIINRAVKTIMFVKDQRVEEMGRLLPPDKQFPLYNYRSPVMIIKLPTLFLYDKGRTFQTPQISTRFLIKRECLKADVQTKILRRAYLKSGRTPSVAY